MLEEHLLEHIHRIAKLRAPNEACGVILPEEFLAVRVVEVPNRSENPSDSFAIHTRDLRDALRAWVEYTERPNDLVFWHTHPNGGVGPSRVDMRNKVAEMKHLVVTLTDFGPVASWY